MKLSELGNLLGGEVLGDPNAEVGKLTSFKKANASDIVILLDSRYSSKLKETASQVLVADRQYNGFNYNVIVKNPRSSFYQLMDMFYGKQPTFSWDIQSNSDFPDSVSIHPSCVVGRHTEIGNGTKIGPHTTIGKHCTIGENVEIFPNVVIYDHTIIKNNVIIQSGAIIGSDGFGYNHHQNQWKKVPHIGNVVVEDNVEIGSNACIDRGCLDDTIIGTGTKIDNLVHIAHNCDIGDNCAIAAQVGMMGRSKLGNGVQIGGQSGITDVSLGDKVIVASRSGVTKNVQSNEMVSGFPARTHKIELKFQAFLRKLFYKSNMK